MHPLLAEHIRDHLWLKTTKTRGEGARFWQCLRCGFSYWAGDGDEPADFELTYNEWDCDYQLAKGIMES